MKSINAKRLARSAELDFDKAVALVGAGYVTPGQIVAASDESLKAVPGIGAATVQKLRRKYGRG